MSRVTMFTEAKAAEKKNSSMVNTTVSKEKPSRHEMTNTIDATFWSRSRLNVDHKLNSYNLNYLQEHCYSLARCLDAFFLCSFQVLFLSQLM